MKEISKLASSNVGLFTVSRSISDCSGAISSKQTVTTCLALRAYYRLVRPEASSHGVESVRRIGLVSRDARNAFSFSLGVKSMANDLSSVRVVEETSDVSHN